MVAVLGVMSPSRHSETTAASNAYVAVLETRTPPEGQLEPEPEPYVPPEVRTRLPKP